MREPSEKLSQVHKTFWFKWEFLWGVHGLMLGIASWGLAWLMVALDLNIPTSIITTWVTYFSLMTFQKRLLQEYGSIKPSKISTFFGVMFLLLSMLLSIGISAIRSWPQRLPGQLLFWGAVGGLIGGIVYGWVSGTLFIKKLK
jgi:hypothetical protein